MIAIQARFIQTFYDYQQLMARHPKASQKKHNGAGHCQVLSFALHSMLVYRDSVLEIQ